MANTIKKGESLLIPFKNGESIYDSQLKPRMYKTKEQYDRFSYRFGDAEMVEYAEVVRCKDCKHKTVTSDGMVCECVLPTKRMQDYYIYGSTILARVEPDAFCSYGERKDNGRKAD